MNDRLVLFAEYTDLDPGPARQLLADHHIRTELLELDAGGRVIPRQQRAIGIIAGYAPVGAELMDQLPNLGIIAASSNGVDMIDVDAAVARGVWVTNVGHAATEEVAVHALALMLAAVRELPAMARTTAEGGWTDELQVQPRRASELTLGLLGCGRIGTEVARIASPIFGRVIAFDPGNPPDGRYAQAASLEEVIATADIVSLHLPSTEATRRIIDAEAFARMRPGAVLVNVSRGDLIDPEACRDALDAGTLGAVCFDVLEHEPGEPEDPFRVHPRAIVTPHAAFLSQAAIQRYELDPAQYVLEWTLDGSPSACVVGLPVARRAPMAHVPSGEATEQEKSVQS